MTSVSSSFDLLAEPVRRWIWEKNWSALRDIQEMAIPLLLQSDQDAIIAAATASGKTEAAFLPLISSVISKESGSDGTGFDLVYISPLKALINDQFRRLEDLCERLELPVYPWHGDVSASVKARARKQRRGILLITPESLEAMFVLRGLEIPALFGRVEAVVVDELHAMLDTERGIHLRSLLNRLEIATRRRIRRVGLSATLGDMDLARAYLRPGSPDTVEVLRSKSEGQALKLQLRGYMIGASKREDDRASSDQEENQVKPEEVAVERAIAEHIFENLRGTQNLVFAGSRRNVEIYSDLLSSMSEEQHLPNEFYPHHANLSRDHRTFVERRLKEAKEPTTAICTSTLELGIDIGDVEAVAQIGAPFSVSSLRQRLGRSGRRAGKPAVLRMYVTEKELQADSHPSDMLRLGLVRSIAMVDLLLEQWCEPPRPDALHLSTLVHQILSVIAERGGAKAAVLFKILCELGPFHLVDADLFSRVLRRMGDPAVALIEQSPDGILLLGRIGERVVEHYGFYAVFQTAEEYRIVSNGKTLGTLPVLTVLAPDMTIIFSGRRWRILAIHDAEKVIEVSRDATGRPPKFGGDGGNIDDTVVRRMRTILAGNDPRKYLDEKAAGLLQEARASFVRLGLEASNIVQIGDGHCLLATWAGTVKNSTMALTLRSEGLMVGNYDGLLDVGADIGRVSDILDQMAVSDAPSGEEIATEIALPATEKFHPYLSPDLLVVDLVASQIESEAIPVMAAQLLEG